MDIRKLPASAGAQWLLDALKLFARSPGGFGTLAVVYAATWLGLAMLAGTAPAVGAFVQFASLVVGALLVALMIYAAHEVDAGRSASLGALLGSLGGGRGGRMVRALVPQAILALLMMGLAAVIIGQENLVKAMEILQDIQAKSQAGVQVDPQTIAGGPLMRVALGGLIVLAISVVIFAFTIPLLPDMLLEGRGLGEALKRSAAAGLRNLPAVLVYLVVGFVLMMAVSIGFGIVLGIAQLAFGPVAALVGNALLYGLFMCVLAGTMYFAWKDMLGGTPTEDAASGDTGVAM
jgi:hypothetical protein